MKKGLVSGECEEELVRKEGAFRNGSDVEKKRPLICEHASNFSGPLAAPAEVVFSIARVIISGVVDPDVVGGGGDYDIDAGGGHRPHALEAVLVAEVDHGAILCQRGRENEDYFSNKRLKFDRMPLSTCLNLMSTSETAERAGTKKALVEAATALFAEHGFESVSLREITGRAEANVASVKYHFGSKEELVDAVVEEMTTPVNAERLKRLGDLREAGAPGVRDLLEAFYEPLLSQVKGSDLGEQLFGKLMGRLVGERPYQFPPEVMAQFRKVAAEFVPAFKKALPDLSERDIFWKIHFSFGVVSTTLMHGDLLKNISEGVVVTEELDLMMARIIDFCEAGFEQGSRSGGGA